MALTARGKDMQRDAGEHQDRSQQERRAGGEDRRVGGGEVREGGGHDQGGGDHGDGVQAGEDALQLALGIGGRRRARRWPEAPG